MNYIYFECEYMTFYEQQIIEVDEFQRYDK